MKPSQDYLREQTFAGDLRYESLLYPNPQNYSFGPYLAINSLNTILYRFAFDGHEQNECKLLFSEESSSLGNSSLEEVDLFTITEE